MGYHKFDSGFHLATLHLMASGQSSRVSGARCTLLSIPSTLWCYLWYDFCIRLLYIFYA